MILSSDIPYAFAATETAPGHLAIRGKLSSDPVDDLDSAAYSVIRAWIADQDPDAELVFDIDSPGGDVTGLEALTRAIVEHPGKTTALVSGCAGSAAYWLASSCDEVVAWPSATIGSIGAMISIRDPDGKERDVIAELSPRKNAVDDPQWQEMIDSTAERFFRHVAMRRGWDSKDLEAVAARCGDGKIMTAAEALSRGLIDRVVEEGNMPEDLMPEVAPEGGEEKSIDEVVRDLLAAKEDHERRIAELEAIVKNQEREVEDDTADLDSARETEDEEGQQAKCDRPRAESLRIAALGREIREVSRRLRDDTIARLSAEGKISAADLETAQYLYEHNKVLFDRRFGRPSAISTVSRISSPEAAPQRTRISDPAAAALEQVRGQKGMSFKELYKRNGGK